MRKAVLILSVFFSLMLFANGIAFISYMRDIGRERIEGRYKIQSGTEDNSSVPENQPCPFNSLVIGYDEEGSRSDVILLLNFSPALGKLNILSIARDTRINYNGRYEKINALTAFEGKSRLIEEVQNMTGLPINYYISLNFKGFRKIIDSVDGVKFDIPFDMDYDDPFQNLHVHLKKGLQQLNGKKAEQLVRYRKGNEKGQGYTDGDIGRIKLQQEFVRAFIDQKLRIKYISSAPEIFSILKKYMTTNIESGDLNYYLKYIRRLNYNKIKSYIIPGESAYKNELWYFIYDVEKTKKLINDNFYK